MAKRGLGKGIDALLGGGLDFSEEEGSLREVEVERLVPQEGQPRKHFDEAALEDLARSIKEKGVLQPLLVEELPGGKFRIVAGERRYRAAKLAGRTTVPVIVRSFTEQERLEIALIENIQREDLTPIEEAQAYRALMEHAGLTQEQLAERLGKSRPVIANALRLLQLPEEMQRALDERTITPGHARAILSVPDDEGRRRLFSQIVKEGLSVREAERRAARVAGDAAGRKTPADERARDPFLRDLEDRCIERLGTKVRIKGSLERGVVEIAYFSKDDLERLIEVLLGGE